MPDQMLAWLHADVPHRDDRFDGPGALGVNGDVARPTLAQAYDYYVKAAVPARRTAGLLGPTADFVEWLRQHDKTAVYSDDEWVAFLRHFTNGDEDDARDLWDGLVCQ